MFEIKAHAFGIRLHGNIDCLNIMSGNIATMSGVVTQSNFAGIPVGTDAIFQVKDNSEGSGSAPDEWSDLFLFLGLSCGEIDFDASDIPIEAGNIQVKP